MSVLRILLVFACLSFPVVHTCAQTLDADLDNALSKLDEGIGLLEQQSPLSSSKLHEASALLSAVIVKHQITTPGIYHALGNSYMLNGDLGHAILSYRRGDRLDPTRLELRDSLVFARSQVQLGVNPNRSNKVWSIALSWRGHLPRVVLWVCFLCLSIIGWCSCAAHVLGLVSQTKRIAGIWMVVVSFIPLSMLGSEWIRYHGSNDAVIIHSDVLARTGPDDTIYEPVFADLLQPGIEVTVLETRDLWNRVELLNGSQCWVPIQSLERVTVQDNDYLTPEL